MASLIYRVYVAYSIDGGNSFTMQKEIYPGSAGTYDHSHTDSSYQLYHGAKLRTHDIIWTEVVGTTGTVRFAIADLPPKPYMPKINKLNRRRTFGNEL